MSLPSLPEKLKEFAESCGDLEGLRQHAGYKFFLDALDELRALNYLDILNSNDQLAILTAVGAGRALWATRQLLEQKVLEGRELIERFDGAHEAYRLRKEAEQRANAFAPAAGPRRSFDTH